MILCEFEMCFEKADPLLLEEQSLLNYNLLYLY